MAITLSQLANDASIVYPASNSYFMSIVKLLFWNVFFGNSLSEFCFNRDTCNYLWLLLLSKFRILKSQKHQFLRLYRVSSLWRQGFSRDNQMYISSQVKSALRKLREGRDHDCDSFMSDGPLHLLNLNALTRILRLQKTYWENDELCE